MTGIFSARTGPHRRYYTNRAGPVGKLTYRIELIGHNTLAHLGMPRELTQPLRRIIEEELWRLVTTG